MAEDNKKEEVKEEETKDASAEAEEKKEETKEEPKEEKKEEKTEEPKEEEKEEDFEVPDEFKEIVEKIEEMSVVQLSDLVSTLEKRFGVSAAAPAAAAGAGGGAEAKSEVNIVLKAAGDQKINVIKAVKEITGLGLKEAKDLVDGAPNTIKESVKTEEAEEMKKKLEEVGAQVELE